MGVMRWLIGGVLAAVVGAGIWALVGCLTHKEIGWIAWGIGFLVGVGVRYAAYLGGEDESDWQGLFAGAMAIAAVIFGKFALYVSLAGWGDQALHAPSFAEIFTPFDLLWFGLAAVTAYKIGVGTYGAD